MKLSLPYLYTQSMKLSGHIVVLHTPDRCTFNWKHLLNDAIPLVEIDRIWNYLLALVDFSPELATISAQHICSTYLLEVRMEMLVKLRIQYGPALL
jgi:hypothetical protein